MLPPQNQIQVENWRVDTHVITHVGHAQHLSINHRAAPAHVYPMSIKMGHCDTGSSGLQETDTIKPKDGKSENGKS